MPYYVSGALQHFAGKCSFFLMCSSHFFFLNRKHFFIHFKNSNWRFFCRSMFDSNVSHMKILQKKIFTCPLTTFVKWLPINIAKCTFSLTRSSFNFCLIRNLFSIRLSKSLKKEIVFSHFHI